MTPAGDRSKNLFAGISTENFFQHHPIGMLVLDPATGSVRKANLAAERFYGYTAEQFTSKTIHNLRVNTGPETVSSSEQSWKPEAAFQVTRHRLAHGELRWVEETLFEMSLPQGTILILMVQNTAAKHEAQMYRELVNLAADGILLGDAHGQITEANERMQEMCGCSQEVLVQKHVSALFTPESLARSPLRFDLLQRGERVVNERVMIRADGSFIDVEMHSKRMPDGRYHSIFRDITARKRTEEALRLSEEKFSKAFTTSPDAVNLNRLSDGVYIDINDGFTAMTGYTRKDVLGRSSLPGELGIWVRKEDRERMTAALRSQGEIHNLEAEFRRKDGTVLYGSMSARVLEIGGVACVLSITRDLSERKQQLDALHESEENFKRLFNAVSEGIVVVDIDTRKFITANNSFTVMLGYPIEEISGLGVDDIHPTESLSEVINQFERLVRREIVMATNIPVLAKDGTIFFCDIAATPFLLQGQKRMMGSFRDVTHRKHEEDARKMYSEYQQALIDNFPFLVWLKDSESRFLAVNKPFAQACGLGSPDAVVGKTDFDVWPRELAEAYHADDRVVLESGIPKSVEEPIEQAGEQRAWFETYKSPVRMGARILGTVGFARDITERKHAEDMLAAERERLLVTLRSIGDGVIATDTGGKIVIMNQVAETLTGWQQAEAQGKSLADVFTIVNESTKERCENPVEKVMMQKTIVELANHTILIAKDGTEHIIGDSGAPILNKDGTIIGVVLVFRDMTEKQRLIETSQKNQKLESLGVLAGGIAHDFNNLLGGIFGYLDLAHTEARDPRVKDYLNSALGSMERARALTHQLLTFAKGGAPVRKIEPLYPFLKETANFALSGSNISYAIEVDSDIWHAEYDKNQLAQVVDNVLINAQQAMPAGGRVHIAAGNVTLRTREHGALPPGEYVRISITDKGMGIPKDIQSRIFDPFFSTKQKGSGLGLATSYSIMSRHNGSIEVESELGHGSTFHLYLPASKEPVQIEKQAKLSLRQGNGRILIMDDEEVIRNAVRAMLSIHGYTVIGAHDGAEAVQQFLRGEREGEPFDAVILDLTVPGGMGGKEAALAIRKQNSNVALIVSSGYAEDPVVATPQDYGFTDSLRKPFTLAELVAVIGKHVR